MSDTVRFATTNDTVTPANSSGGNGFPFPFATGSTGTGTDNPIKLTYQQAIGWWWRVKNWALTSSWSVSDSVSDTASFVNSNPFAPAETNAGTERDLIHTVNPVTTNPVTHLFQPDGGSLAQQFNFEIDPSFILDLDGVHVWPKIACPSTQLIPFSGGAQAYFAFNPANLPAAPTGTTTATIDGVNCDLYYYVNVGTGSYVAGSVTITPVEFWPYAALADGSPVYDTTTGAVLAGCSPTN